MILEWILDERRNSTVSVRRVLPMTYSNTSGGPPRVGHSYGAWYLATALRQFYAIQLYDVASFFVVGRSSVTSACLMGTSLAHIVPRVSRTCQRIVGASLMIIACSISSSCVCGMRPTLRALENLLRRPLAPWQTTSDFCLGSDGRRCGARS